MNNRFYISRCISEPHKVAMGKFSSTSKTQKVYRSGRRNEWEDVLVWETDDGQASILEASMHYIFKDYLCAGKDYTKCKSHSQKRATGSPEKGFNSVYGMLPWFFDWLGNKGQRKLSDLCLPHYVPKTVKDRIRNVSFTNWASVKSTRRCS